MVFRKAIMLFVVSIFFMLAYLLSKDTFYIFLSMFMALSGAVLIVLDTKHKARLKKIEEDDDDEDYKDGKQF